MSIAIALTVPLIQLNPDVPLTCPSAAAIVREIEDAVPPDLAPIRLRLSIMEDDAVVRARFEASHPDWKQTVSRELRGLRSDCAALVSAVAFSTSLALDELASVATPAESRWMYSYHAGLYLASGPLPDAGAMAELGGRLHRSHWRLGGSVRAHFAEAVSVGEGSVEGHLVAGCLTACVRWRAFHACGLGVGGWQHFRGRGFDIDRSDSAAYLSTGVRGEYALPLGQVWHVGVAVEGQRVLSPVRLNVSGMPEGHNPAVVGALGVDVAHSF